MNDRALKSLISLSCFVALAACGGGSGGSGSPSAQPTPPTGTPPPPANSAPTFVATAPAETVFEGRIIEIRVRGTNDPDGDSVRFDITQLSGPTAPLLTNLAGEEPSYIFEAPSIATPGGIETLIFEAAGMDGVNDPVTQQVTVTVRDNEQPGLPIAQIEPGDRVFAEQYSSFNSRRATNEVNLLKPNGLEAEISKLAGGFHDSFGSYSEAEGMIQFHPEDIILFDPLWFNGVTRPTGPDFIVLSNDRDALEWYTNEYLFDGDGFITGTRMLLQQSEPFTDPCTVVERASTGNDFAWVGLREGGVVVTEVTPVEATDGTTVSFEQNRLQTLGAGRSLCFVFPTELPKRFDPANTINIRPGLITVDFLNKELLLVADTDSDGIWEELEVVPLDLSGNPNLEIIDVLATGSPSLVPRYIAILVSDGIDGGDHRVIVVAQGDDDLEIYQETYQWSGGTPIKLLRGPFAGQAGILSDLAGNQFRQDLAVVSDTATGNVLLRDISYPNPVADVPVFAQPEPFPFMAGASSAITATYFLDGADPDSYANFGIVATFPDDRSLRFFGLNSE